MKNINHNNLISNNSISLDGLNIQPNNTDKDGKEVSNSRELMEKTNKVQNNNNRIEQNIHEIAHILYW